MTESLKSSVALINAVSAEQYPHNVHPYRDKVFITATPRLMTDNGILSPEEYLDDDTCRLNSIHLDIDDQTPVAALDNKLADEHGLASIPRIRSGQTALPQWLISGGMLLSDPNGNPILFERTVTNPANGNVIAWPKALNNPMGRCDTLPSLVCLKEGAQEILITEDADRTVRKPLMFTFNGKSGILLPEELDLQAKTIAHLKVQGQNLLLSETGQITAAPDEHYADQLVTVKTYMNNVLTDSFKAVAAFSRAERTLELAIPARLQHPNPDRLGYLAREPFGRATVSRSPEQLQATHYGWAKGMLGTIQDPQQNRMVHLGGLLPILQAAALGMKRTVSRPEEVAVPKEWPDDRIKAVLGL